MFNNSNRTCLFFSEQTDQYLFMLWTTVCTFKQTRELFKYLHSYATGGTDYFLQLAVYIAELYNNFQENVYVVYL